MEAVPERADEHQTSVPADEKATSAGAADASRWSNWSRPTAFAVAAVMFFGSLATSGIWDPYELDAAEFSRRIAIHVFGAKNLELADATNSMPTLSDLRMGELPFTSMALGFKLFGLRDWTGRLPLALWALVGVIALHELLLRLSGRKAAFYGAVVLATMPMYFMQARTMLGDIVTMSALSLAFSGLIGALADRSRTGRESKTLLVKGTWLLVAGVGLVSGYLSRGLLIGVAIPTLTAGLCWLAVCQGGKRSVAENVLGVTSLVGGVVVTYFAVKLYVNTSATDPLPRSLAVVPVAKPGVEVTFDRTIRHLGHAIFPWSAFIPVAVGRLFRAPEGLEPEAARRETDLRIALLVGVAVAFGAYAFAAPYAVFVPFSAVALLAAIAAVVVADFDRTGLPSRTMALGTLLLAFVLYRDMQLEPARIFSVFEVDKPSFPKSFELQATSLMRLSALSFAALVGVAWFESNEERTQTSFKAWLDDFFAGFRRSIETLILIWNGNLLFGLVVVEAALVGLGLMLFVGTRFGWASTEKLPKNFVEVGLNLWWAMPLVSVALASLAVIVRDAFRVLFQRTRLPRGAAVFCAAIFAGAVLSFGYFPALAAQISPKEVLDAYARLQQPGEPLGLLGVRARSIAYYERDSEVFSFGGPTQAFEWLTAGSDRRWLIVKADDLPKLNSMHRRLKGTNLPVLDARSSQILLVSNVLGDRPNENPLRNIVLDETPTPPHLVDAQFEDQLEMIGWEVRESSGEIVESVVPQRKYHLRFYYRVLKPLMPGWKVFLHIDGFQRRYNGDHTILDGKYAFNLWQPNDVLVDDYVFELEPNFTPGDYSIFVGFFSGETRLRVTRGNQQDNRVIAGSLRVR